MLTTTEAGRLIGRTGNAVRKAVSAGHLPGTWVHDHWLVSASAVLAWAARTPPGRGGPQLPVPRTEDVVRVLGEYGSASADEVATLLRLHPGNARKYLAMLGLQGRAYRREDGQWLLVGDSSHEGAPK
jgi:hypothetical protein